MLYQKSDFLKYKDFETRYKAKTKFVKYYGVVSSLTKLKKYFQDQATMNSTDQITRSQKLVSSSSFRNEVYKLIVKGITSTPDKSQNKWIAYCENYKNLIKWDKSYSALLLHERN